MNTGYEQATQRRRLGPQRGCTNSGGFARARCEDSINVSKPLDSGRWAFVSAITGDTNGGRSSLRRVRFNANRVNERFKLYLVSGAGLASGATNGGRPLRCRRVNDATNVRLQSDATLRNPTLCYKITEITHQQKTTRRSRVRVCVEGGSGDNMKQRETLSAEIREQPTQNRRR